MYAIDIKQFRRVNKMTQTALAEYLGITQAFISNMEAGRDTVPEKYIRKILDDPNVDSSMVKGGDLDDIAEVSQVAMPREVFDKISQLIDTVCAQQETIASQQRTIEHFALSDRRTGVHAADNVGAADVG